MAFNFQQFQTILSRKFSPVTAKQSYIVPSGDNISSRQEVSTREIKPNVRSAYIQSFSTESKNFLNTSRWSRIVQTFLSTSTLHGVSHLRPPCSRRQKCFWLFAILSCGTFFLVHASVLVYNALTRPYLSTTLTLKYRDLDGPLLNKYDKITKFPGITVCGLTPFKREDFEDSFSLPMYYALSLGYPYSGLTLEQRINLHEVATKSDEWINSHNSTLWIYREKIFNFTQSIQRNDISEILWKYSYRCKDVFRRCSVGFEILDCCSVFIPILTTYGYCYALQINKTTLGALEMETLPFIIDLHVPPSNTTDSEEGYLLLVHDPRFNPRMILPKDGLLVAPGVTMSLRLTLRVTDYSAKYAKWFGLVTDCPKVACMQEDYSIQECVFQNAAFKIRDICHCSWILDECRSGSASDVPVCGPRDMIDCVITQATRILKVAFLFLIILLVITTIYIISTIYHHYLITKHLYTEAVRPFLDGFDGDIGGAMGLLLGASCLTGVELLTFFGQWMYFTFFDK